MASDKTKYVFSTLACDQLYTAWTPTSNDMKEKGHQVFIKGGAGVANDRIITPLGVMTEITEDQFAILQQNEDFKRHVKAGFLTVQDKKHDVEKVAADMNRQDPSAPKTPESPEFAKTEDEKASA